MKNSKGISLIALIITIIVIIILAAIVIGGVFNTPNDAKFANFCQLYDQLQTEVQLKYYELYEAYAINPATSVLPTHYEIYQEVADGTNAGTVAQGSTRVRADKWVEITNWTALTKPSVTGTSDKWFLRLSDGKIAFSGFEKEEKNFYYTPSIYSEGTRSKITLSNGALTLSPTGTLKPTTTSLDAVSGS